MAVYERRQTQKTKGPSFSSSVLNTIYHSTDESISNDTNQHKREVEDIETLRRALMIEKWLEHSSSSNSSSSSTESSVCSLPETISTSNPKPSLFDLHNPKQAKKKTLVDSLGTHIQNEPKLARARSKLNEESKKVKEPSSPGGKIKHFLNSIFVSRNTTKRFTAHSEESGSMRKSKSMKDTITNTTTSSSTVEYSKSCLIKNLSARGNYKSKSGVRFCPVNKIILDDDENTKRIEEINIVKINQDAVSSFSDAKALSSNCISSQFIKKNMDSLQNGESDLDDDVRSCGSSDLFELENICGSS